MISLPYMKLDVTEGRYFQPPRYRHELLQFSPNSDKTQLQDKKNYINKIQGLNETETFNFFSYYNYQVEAIFVLV